MFRFLSFHNFIWKIFVHKKSLIRTVNTGFRPHNIYLLFRILYQCTQIKWLLSTKKMVLNAGLKIFNNNLICFEKDKILRAKNALRFSSPKYVIKVFSETNQMLNNTSIYFLYIRLSTGTWVDIWTWCWNQTGQMTWMLPELYNRLTKIYSSG